MHELSRLRPLSVGDLFDETIRVVRRRFGALAALGLLYALPQALFGLAAPAIGAGDVDVASVLANLISVPVGFAMWALTSTASIHLVAEDRLGRRIGVRDALGRGLGQWWRVGLLTFVSLIASGLLMVAAVTLIGLPLAIYFLVAWAFVQYAMVLEGTGVWGSFRRSRELVRGRWWRTFGVALLFSVFIMVLSSLVALPFMLVGALPALLSGGGIGDLPDVMAMISSPLGGLVSGALWQMLLVVAMTLYYLDLRVRKEGLDLALQAEALGTPAGAPSAL